MHVLGTVAGWTQVSNTAVIANYPGHIHNTLLGQSAGCSMQLVAVPR